MASGTNEKKELKAEVMSGLVWTFWERIFAQGVSFVVSIILARKLMPEEYGVISIVLVFINLANVFVSNGLGEALVKKVDADEEDYSSIFVCSFVLSWILYLLLFMFAPAISRFYRIEKLTGLLRVLALKIPISSISTVQHAYVSAHMEFRKFFLSTLGGTVVSGIAGIVMAFSEFGAWALVTQYLVNTIVDTIVLFFTVPWRPVFKFNSNSAKKLFGYGWKLTVASFINQLYSEARSLVIGRIYTSEDLAYYNRGNQFPSLIITNIDASIGKVVFPAMTKVAENKENLKAVSRRALKTAAYVIFPMMAGLFAVAEPLVKVLLTDKWIYCVPFLQYNCLFFACQPIQTTNWQVIKASGRSDLCLILEVIKKIIGFSIIVLTMRQSVTAIAQGNALFAVISMTINAIPNKKLIDYSILDQMKDLLPSIALSMLMAVAIYPLNMLSMPSIVILVGQVLIGIGIYITGSIIMKSETFYYLLDTAKRIIIKKSK